jgi:hypothetical protein
MVASDSGPETPNLGLLGAACSLVGSTGGRPTDTLTSRIGSAVPNERDPHLRERRLRPNKPPVRSFNHSALQCQKRKLKSERCKGK